VPARDLKRKRDLSFVDKIHLEASGGSILAGMWKHIKILMGGHVRGVNI